MKKPFILLCLLIFFVKINAQSFTISGIIEDEASGEQLVSANVYEANTLTGIASNYYGFYSLTLPEGHVTIIYSYIGYQNIQVSFDLTKDTVINMKLHQNLMIDEVTITDRGPAATVRSSQMSMVEIPMIQAKQLPVLLGEVDLIKTIQLLPGVQGGTEGLSGLYVRGGGPSENLILLDGVPVYNVSHLFGFFSVFNADAIQNFSLYKGGFPARYGGRLSSVLDIKMKEGNMNEFKGTGSIGLIASNLTLEGPIVKNKASFIISARRSYIDVLTWPIQKNYSRKQGDGYDVIAGYYLYDLNAKVNYKFSDKSRLYFSIYTGKDKFYAKSEIEDEYSTFKNNMNFWWGNITSSLRWNYILSNNLFCNVTGTYSRYKMQISEEFSFKNNLNTSDGFGDQDYSFIYYSGIEDYSVKADFDFIPGNKHNIRFGINNTIHVFKPGVTVETLDSETGISVDTTFGKKNIIANELSLYFEDEISLTDKLKANIGCRTSYFNVRNTDYYSVEPRISARYLLTDNISVKSAYSYMQQYIHLLTNSGASLPTDLWVPVTDTIKPMKSWQAAFGFAVNLKKGFEFTAEGYYKELSNVIEYKEGASYLDEEGDWEENVEMGKGWSYGVELLLQRQQGNTKGWIGYTLSWANRQFDNISSGKVFPFKYDRRHDLSIAVTHTFKNNIDLGLTWVYGTGYPFTFGNQRYYSLLPVINLKGDNMFFGGNSEFIEYIEHRNNYKLPNYHRLDLGVTYNKTKKKTQRSISVGAYNVYNRQNALFLFMSVEQKYNPDTGQYVPVKKLKQASMFPILPYFRYTIKF